MRILLIAVILVVVGFMFPLGAFIYIKKDDNNKKSGKYINNTDIKDIKSDVKKEDKHFKPLEIKKLIGIDDIKDNVVTLMNGNRRIILGISSPDISILTDDEINFMELKLLQFAISLSDSIQFFTTPTRIETKEPANLVLKTVESDDESIPEGLKVYADNLYSSYKRIEDSRGVYVLKSFCVIGTSLKDKARALNDLRYKCNIVLSKLIGAKMRVSVLNSVQGAQLFTDILQRGDNVQIEKLVKNGALELYTEGIGQEIYSSEGENNEVKEGESDVSKKEEIS